MLGTSYTTPASGQVLGSEHHPQTIETRHTIVDTVGEVLHNIKEGVMHTGASVVEGLKNVTGLSHEEVPHGEATIHSSTNVATTTAPSLVPPGTETSPNPQFVPSGGPLLREVPSTQEAARIQDQ
jgi:hypothetical protein